MRYLTAGESHGPKLTTIIEGLPAGMPLLQEDINEQLARRQKGHGRGRRMQIEKDTVEITSGVRHGLTLGSPVALVVENNDCSQCPQRPRANEACLYPRCRRGDRARHDT